MRYIAEAFLFPKRGRPVSDRAQIRWSTTCTYVYSNLATIHPGKIKGGARLRVCVVDLQHRHFITIFTFSIFNIMPKITPLSREFKAEFGLKQNM